MTFLTDGARTAGGRWAAAFRVAFSEVGPVVVDVVSTALAVRRMKVEVRRKWVVRPT